MQNTEEIIEQYHNLMRAGLDELAVNDKENAEEYFSDACFVLNEIRNTELRNKLANMYEINPYDCER